MHPRFAAAFGSACCALVPALAQSPDPLKSPACATAIEELQAARDAHATDKATIEKLRQRAANVCLGAASPPARPGRVLQAPITLYPPATTAPRAPAIAAPKPPPPPVAIPRPATVTACDPGGCWMNDGTRLNYVGPNLMGPNGLCTMQGAVIHCP